MIEYGELSFKIVRLEPGGQEVIVRAGNYEVCKTAFDKALFVYPTQHLSSTRRSTSNCARVRASSASRGRVDYLSLRRF
jgi:hypothetical protein